MKKSELTNLIREAVNEVFSEMEQTNESSPPNFPPALKNKLIKKYGKTPKAYATMWTLSKKMNEGDSKVKEMWMQFESKSVNEDIPDEDPNNPLYVEYVKDMTGEEPFMMGNTKWQYVMAKYPNGKKDIGVYSFAEDMVYGYNAFRSKFNLKENKGGEHDEADMSNPEEKREVELANQIKKLANDLLAIHGSESQEDANKAGEVVDIDDDDEKETPVTGTKKKRSKKK